MGPIEKLSEEMSELPREVVDGIDADDADLAANEAAWAQEIGWRVQEIRDGTAELYDLEDVLAEMEERYEAEIDDAALSSADDDLADPVDVEAAWAEEIKQRIDEVSAGTVRTCAAEDVMAVLRLRFG
jgi:hypothetical protein